MAKAHSLIIATALSTAFAGAALAEQASINTNNTAFEKQSSATDAVDNIQEQIREDRKRDTLTFGNTGRRQGWTGSVSARLTASSGNSKSSNVGAGARVGYFDGVNGHQINLSYAMASENGKRNKDELLLGYDYTRELGSNTFVYGKLVGTYDKFGSYESDVFAGAGVGYRVINNGQTQWSVQAGPGYRVAKLVDGTKEIDDVAASLSSDFKHRFNDQMFMTNDTDVLWAEKNTTVLNELGLNMRMTEGTVLRASVLTQYDSDPQPNRKTTDNTLGLSVVYNFN